MVGLQFGGAVNAAATVWPSCPVAGMVIVGAEGPSGLYLK